MTNQNAEIHAAFEQLRDFCQQVSLMLGTTNILMKKEGWSRAGKDDTVFDSTSASLKKPRKWLPTFFCHFYQNPAYPEFLCFVSVIVGYWKPERVTQSIVSAGWLEFHGSAPRQPTYWWGRSHIWGTDQRRDDGTACEHDLIKIWKRERPANIKSVVTFALPLDSVSSQQRLHDSVIEPLLRERKQHRYDPKLSLNRAGELVPAVDDEAIEDAEIDEADAGGE